MTLPLDPPATTSPTALKTWMQSTVDTVTDHETRIVAAEGGSSAGSSLYLHANYR